MSDEQLRAELDQLFAKYGGRIDLFRLAVNDWLNDVDPDYDEPDDEDEDDLFADFDDEDD